MILQASVYQAVAIIGTLIVLKLNFDHLEVQLRPPRSSTLTRSKYSPDFQRV